MAVKVTFGSGLGTLSGRVVMPFPTKTLDGMSVWKPQCEKVKMFRIEFQFTEAFHFSQGIILQIQVKSS